jgi:hypothetical protein
MLLWREYSFAEAIRKHYEKSIMLPAQNELPADGKNALPELKDVATLFEANPRNAQRVRNVTLPEFFSVSAKGSDIGALIPVGTVLASIGASSEDISSVSISVPSASSYGLPHKDAVDIINERIKQP